MAGWVYNIGTLLDHLDPVDNILLLWDQFLENFAQQYQDSAKEDHACLGLQRLCVRDGDIDAYVSKFEEFACKANYTTGNPETTQLFMQGFPPSTLKDVMRAPPVRGYEAIKERAVYSTQAQCVIWNFQRSLGGP